MGGRSPFHWLGTRASFTVGRASALISGSLVKGSAFIGPSWMRISASRIFSLADAPVKASNHLKSGSPRATHGREIPPLGRSGKPRPLPAPRLCPSDFAFRLGEDAPLQPAT